MIKLKEIIIIIFSVIVLAFSYSFSNLSIFFQSLIFFLIIMGVYVAAQKISAHYFEIETETNIWTEKRYGFAEKSHLNTGIPVGFILAFLFPFLSYGIASWFVLTETELKATSARIARRHGLFSWADLTEWNISLICSAGVLAMFILSIIAYFLNLPILARLCTYYAFFNLIPFGNLDGAKIFFGSAKYWFGLFVISILGLILAFSLI